MDFSRSQTSQPFSFMSTLATRGYSLSPPTCFDIPNLTYTERIIQCTFDLWPLADCPNELQAGARHHSPPPSYPLCRKGLNIKSTHLPITQQDIVWIHHSVLPLTFNPCQAAFFHPLWLQGLNINDDTVSPSCLACFNNLQLLQGWTYNDFYNLWPLTSVRLP